MDCGGFETGINEGYIIPTMKNKRTLLSVLLGVLLFSGASFALEPLNEGWVWDGVAGGATGVATEVGDDGYVYALGVSTGCANNIYVTKIDPKNNSESWHMQYDQWCMSEDPYDIKVRGNSVYVSGSLGGGSGVVMKLGSKDGAIVWKYMASGCSAVRGLAVDPADGTIWAVSNRNVAPMVGVLLHLRDNGDGFEEINREELWNQGEMTDTWDVAVTGDMVYVCGSGNSMGMPYPWIWGRSKSNSSDTFSMLDSAYGMSNVNFAMGVATDNIFAVSGNPAGGSNTYVTSYFRDSKMRISGKVYSWMGGSGLTYPRLTVHPTQGIAVVSGGNSFYSLKAYDSKLNEKWTINPFTGPGMVNSVNGVSFEPGLYGNMFVAGCVDGGMRVAKIGFRDTDRKTSEMIIAPNVIDLSQGMKSAGISIKMGPDKDFMIQISDSAGNFLRKLEGRSNSQGMGNAAWDLRDRNGKMVAPGTYYAVSDAEGGMRKPLMVVLRRTQ